MKYLIIGLGNPGSKYINTRHNIGFQVLDRLSSFSDTTFYQQKLANTAEVRFRGRKLVLVKPNTYMNLSGKAVLYWIRKSKVPIDRILVITDDIALPFGVLRLRSKGSDGGHNGLRDIQNSLGHINYARLKFGVGNDFIKGRQAEYVLSEFLETEQENILERIDIAVEMIYSFVTQGISRTMSDFNSK
tara:strand:- start:586 stop:1149 length:564 start_codon:yes stop_codon:yes gene_type:complete